MALRSSGDEEESIDAQALRLATDEENATFAVRKRLFFAIGVLNIAMNFDSGVLPATCVACSTCSRRAIAGLRAGLAGGLPPPPPQTLRDIRCAASALTSTVAMVCCRLGHVQEQFDFSYTELGILGALVYSALASLPAEAPRPTSPLASA